MIRITLFTICWLLNLLNAFMVGIYYQSYYHGEVRLYTNVEIPGDELNHGQQSISIKFPNSIRPEYVWLPSGDMYPDDSKLRWVKVSPEGVPQRGLDEMSFYIANEKCPTPGCRLGAAPLR